VLRDDHSAQIQRAAHLLGGASAARRFTLTIEDMIDAVVPNRRLERELDELDALLSLRHLDCQDAPGASLFATINPISPIVDEICALLDALRECRAADRRVAA
jgi:hypothetical protein